MAKKMTKVGLSLACVAALGAAQLAPVAVPVFGYTSVKAESPTEEIVAVVIRGVDANSELLSGPSQTLHPKSDNYTVVAEDIEGYTPVSYLVLAQSFLWETRGNGGEASFSHQDAFSRGETLVDVIFTYVKNESQPKSPEAVPTPPSTDNQPGQPTSPTPPSPDEQPGQPTPPAPPSADEQPGQPTPPAPPSPDEQPGQPTPPAPPSPDEQPGQPTPPAPPSPDEQPGQPTPPAPPSPDEQPGQPTPPSPPSSDEQPGQPTPPAPPSADEQPGQPTPTTPPSADEKPGQLTSPTPAPKTDGAEAGKEAAKPSTNPTSAQALPATQQSAKATGSSSKTLPNTGDVTVEPLALAGLGLFLASLGLRHLKKELD